MNKRLGVLFSALSLTMALASTAHAADSSYNWGGFYAGAHLGWSWDNRDAAIKNSLTSASLVSGNTNSNGITGGGQIGYNYVLPYSWMVGLEADVSGADLNGSRTTGSIYGQRDNNIDAYGTARARLGYGLDNLLFYGTGGFAWANEDMTRTQQIGTVNNATPGTRESDSSMGTGWTAGAGVEWGFAQNLTARLEYLHLDLGDQSFVFPAAQQRINVNSAFDVLRVGVNYKFD